jgi:hypothetical protein
MNRNLKTHSWTQTLDDQGQLWRLELQIDAADLLQYLGQKAIRNTKHVSRQVSGAVVVKATKKR